ncbi:hypothetical protein EVAR_76074_1 [Eumeta japonica]|uniref:Uncharacterized protein n=1 Tax=Eumeta variegata TaxID=151549 RepID=A0A4C1W5H5_EUMVA|nr:hypothetical protein EVAR_76074_1 [Eumeta japonica]
MKRSIAGRGSDVPAQRRRSSILKTVKAPRTPLAELETKPITPTDQTISRRVSFSRRTGVAEFITHEATTTWKNVYEEHHNFTVDSFVNDSEGRSSGGPGRLFQGEFEDVEAELNAVDEPPVLNSRDTQGHQATASINLTEQFAALETVSNCTHNPTAPVCHFEVSARTDNNLKPFGDDITEFIIGERSGVIEVDFSAVETIQPSNEFNENNSLDLKYLEEAERDCAHINRLPISPKSELNSAPECGEADMSLTDTVRPPCVGPPPISRVLCNTVPKPNDWIADKENILLTSPQKANQSTIKTQDKVLVYDGKKLKYANMDDDLDALEDPLPRINRNHAHINNKKEDKSMTLGIARTSQQTNTLVFDKDDLRANISITECIPSTVNNYHNESKDAKVNNENMDLTAGVSQLTRNFKSNSTVLDDDADMSITRCAPTVERDYIQPRNCITTHMRPDSKYITVCDVDVPIVQCLPPGLRSSVISSLISSKRGINTSSDRNTIIVGKDDIETEISMKQCDNGRFVLNRKIEHPSLYKTQEISSENRQTMIHGKNDVNSDISVVKYAHTEIVEDPKVRTIEQNISSNNKRRTILFEQNNADADMSVTQCANIQIIGDENVTNPNQGNSIDKKRHTILFERDNVDADMSVTHCANIKIIGNNNLENHNQNINTDNKRRTILFEQDNADADMSVTQCANIEIIEDEHVTNPNQGNSTDKKRHTILFERDNVDADMSVTQCANIKIIGDKTVTNTNNGISTDNKRHTVLFECGNVNADMSVTQCANSNQIIQDGNFINPNLEIANDNKTCTIVFEQDNVDADMSVTRCANVQIIKDKSIVNSDQDIGTNNKRRTILFEKDNMDANMSITQCAKSIVNPNQVDTTNKRHTVLFEPDNMSADITSLSKTDNASSNNPKRAAMLFEKDDHLSMSHFANVRRIGDRDITYVTIAKTDHGVNNSNSVNICENEDKILQNIQSVKSPNILCPSDIFTEESIIGTHMDSLRFEDCIVKGGQQYLNEIDITRNGSLRKNNTFEVEMLETEDIPNTFKSQNDMNTKKINSQLLSDSKCHDIVMPYTQRKEISLVFEKDNNVAVPTCGPTRAKSFLESTPHDHHSSQGVETKMYTREVDKISKSFNAFDINESQASTVCAPVHVKYKPDRCSSSRLKTVHQKPTYDAELQTQNIENKYTSQDNISYSNVDAINSSKKSVLNQLLDMSTDPLNVVDEQELLEEEEETISESSDEDKSSQITSATEELVKSNRQSLRCSIKPELDLESVPSLDSAPRTGVSDSSLTTSDECANTLAVKLNCLNNSKFERRTTLNRRFESVISAVTEDPNDTVELLEALDHLTEPNSKSFNKSHRLSTIDSCTTTDNVDLSRRSVAVNVNSESETLQKPRTEDSAVGPDIADEWARRRTLRFQDEIDASPAERNHERLSPLKKTHCLETSHVESVPQKTKVIPKYLSEMSDGVKELMSDLMKPMVDMLPHTSVCAAPVPDHETHGEQADLAVSSQVSSMHEMEPICPVHQSTEDPPTPQTPPNPRMSPSHLRRDISEAARRAVNRALHRRKSFEPPSIDASPKSSNLHSEDEEEIPESRSVSPPRVLTFDKENPLNNILLRPYVPSELPSASPSAHDHYCLNESTSSSREAIDPTNVHYCPKHGVRSSQKPMDIGCLTVKYDMQKNTAHSAIVSTSPAPVRIPSPSPLLETRVAELKDTEVNTFIAMKTNAQILHADSELTVADAGDPPLTVAYRCRGSPVETSESELNLPARHLKRPHVAPVVGTPSPRPPQKVYRRPTSPKTLMTAVFDHNSPTRERHTSVSPPSKGSSPMHSSPTNKINKSSDKIGSFSSSREHGPVYAPVYTAPASPPSNLRAQIDALPFMGSRDCEWETAVTRAERGETHRRGAWWWFRLLHSRLRLGVRIAHVAGTSPEGDAVLAELVVTADLHGCRDPVVLLCVRLAAEAARAVCAKEAGATAGRTPLLLQRLANLSRLAAQWGRALHDARLSLALAVEEHGAVSFNVANVPLRCVWEVRMHVELSPPEEPARAPWPRAARATARLASPGRAAALTAGELQGILSEVPHNWGHVPTTIWRVFRYLKNKTHYEACCERDARIRIL